MNDTRDLVGVRYGRFFPVDTAPISYVGCSGYRSEWEIRVSGSLALGLRSQTVVIIRTEMSLILY